MDLREGVAPPVTAKQPTNPTAQLWRLGALFLLAGFVAYLIVTGPSYWKRATYWFAHVGQDNVAEEYIDLNAPANSFSGAVGAALRQPTFVRGDIPSTTEDRVTAPQIADNLNVEEHHLVIPKIGVKTPIVWNSSSNEQVMLANLQQGVAHYGFTSLPNPDTGNVFLTGHSSYYWWDKGQYKTVFALLDQLTAGDQAFLQFEGDIYVYTLRDEIVVSPNQVEVTDPTTEPTLSLMTCTPVGTTLNRLVSRFKLAKVYAADDSGSSTPNTPPADSELPTIDLPGQNVPHNRDSIRLLPGLR